MGTQVQCQTYSSGSYSVRDLNKDAGTSWSQCYEDQVLSEHQYQGFVLRPLDGYSKYVKEKLKQIMLEHEAIFKKQVYELHRLYRIQKDLMYEFQKKGLHKYFVQAEVSQSHSFSSQMPSEDTKTKWQMPHLPVVSNSCNTTPIAGTDDKRPPLNFFKESSLQSSQFCFKNGTLQRDSDIQESNLGRFPRRMFDLQLSADVYINSEDGVTEGRENLAKSSSRYAIPITRVYSADPLNGIQLTLGTGERQKNSCKPESLHKNDLRGDTLADLNKPTQQMFHDILAGSTSIHSNSPRTVHEARPNQLPVVSNMSFLGLQSALSKHKQNDESSRSNLSYAALEERRQEWLTYSEAEESGTGDSFYSSGFHNEKLPVSSEPIQLKPAKSHEIILPTQVNTWFGQKPAPGTDIFGRAPSLAILNKSGPSAPGTPSLFPVVPNNLDYTCATPVVSALTAPVKTISNMVPPLPCFSGSVEAHVQSKRPRTMTYDTWQHNGDLKPHLRLGTEVPFNGNFRSDANSSPFSKLNLNNKGDCSASWNDGYEPQKYLSLHCAYINKSATDLYLKKELPDRNQDGPTNQQDEGVSTLKGKPTCSEFVHLYKCSSQMEYDFSQGYPKLAPSSNGVNLEWDWRPEKKKGSFLRNSQEFPSASPVESIMWRNEVPESSICKKILGFPVFDKIDQSAKCLPSHQGHSIADDKDRGKNGAGYIEFPSDTEAPSLEKQVHVGDVVLEGKRLNNLINLNSTYNPYSTEMSPAGEMVFPSRFTTPTVAAKIVSRIDSENTLPQEEYVPSSKMDGSRDTECSREALVREAAENIIQMSLDKHSSVNGITCGQSPPDTLHWFADVVLSKDVLAPTLAAGGDGCSEFPDDGLDDFELMTLKLEDSKVDEYWSRQQELENQKEGEKGASASLLLTRPRRRQGRVRRQRRDFQKDILPGLASLSRHEVKEDLQTIEALMKSSGISWQMGLTRWNTVRNGLHSNARGRRRPRSSSVTVPDIRVSPPPLQPTNVQLEIQRLPVLGWGKTTRRCRRADMLTC